MADLAHAVYDRLPAPLQSVAASMRGLYLRRWRVGPGYARQVEETLDRETWSAARWQAWEDERLGRLLHRAATQVPYYRAYWAARRRNGDAASYELLANWPILDKDTVRAQPLAFVADDVDPRHLFLEHTSGTSGTPLEVRRSRATLTTLYAMAEARTLWWHGIAPDTRWARLGGQLVVPSTRTRPPFWVWNAAMHQLYMSTFHLAPSFIPAYLDALRRFGVRYIAAYTSSLAALAHGVLASGRDDIRLAAAFTNAEGVDAAQRRAIESAFHCHVRETYGQAEMVAAASECPAGRLHQWPEAGHIEVLDEDTDTPAATGTPGALICTGLLNVDVPLVRYRIGDRGQLAPAGQRCECGRGLPLVERIEGRTNDMLLTRDGRKVFWLNPVFYGLPLRESQIEQADYDSVLVRVAPTEAFDAVRDGAVIAERLRARLGAVRITLDVVPTIPRTANGKLRGVICHLAADAPPLPASAEAIGV